MAEKLFLTLLESERDLERKELRLMPNERVPERALVAGVVGRRAWLKVQHERLRNIIERGVLALNLQVRSHMLGGRGFNAARSKLQLAEWLISTHRCLRRTEPTL